jgi:hypothetical protein
MTVWRRQPFVHRQEPGAVGDEQDAAALIPRLQFRAAEAGGGSQIPFHVFRRAGGSRGENFEAE